MYFKSLELVGFKSFVDETKLEFDPGITAIVGPNGCGKSNICDAIRWVLGEQSSKMLRGNKMDDFIFNGSEGRKPLNMAEVSLTITNLNGAITAPELSAYDEITVARRLFRSGESEYYINKTLCRLKDVVDLFLDTGISTRGFSIIEQGQVNRIISSKPEERRFIIEEAAGVMKYKHRRNAAIQKLESSQQNLLRIGDIVGELERQMNSLKRQANKAERYKKYSGEKKELGLKLLSSEMKNIRNILAGTEAEYDSYKEKETEASARSSSAKNRVETLRMKLTAEEKALSALRQEEFELVSRIERDEERLSLMKARLDDLSDEDIRAGEEIEGLKKEIEINDSQYKDRVSEMEGIKLRIEDAKRLYEEKEGRLHEMNKEYRERQSAVEAIDSEIIRLIGQISQKKNTLTSLDTKLDLLQKRRERVLAEKREIEENIIKSQESGVRSQELLTKIRMQLEGLKKEKEDLSGELRVKSEELRIEEEALSEIKTRLESRNSLLKSLEELQSNYEGYEDGVRSIMKSKESGGLNGVHGVLVDFIEASPELETAVEAVLSGRLQGIVVDDHVEGMKGVEYLKSHTAGRAQFIPLTLRNISKSGYTPNGSSGVIGKASELLKCTEKYKNILDSLLGDVLIVRDMESALNIWRSNGVHYTIVTLDGEVIDPYGSITGGKKGAGEQGLMQRKRQMAEIKAEIENLKIELKSSAEKRDQKRKEMESLELRIKEKENFLRDDEIRLINEDNVFTKIKEEIERLKKKMDTLEFEHKEFDAEIEEFSAEADRCKKEIAEEEGRHGRAVSQVGILKEDMKSLRQNLDAVMEEANKLKIELTSLNGNLEGIRRDIERIENTKRDLSLRIEKRGNDRADIAERRKETEDSIRDKEEEIHQVSLRRDEKNKEIITKEEYVRGQAESLKAIEEEVRIIEGELERLRETVNSLSIKKAEMSLQMDNLKRRGVEEYNLPEIPEAEGEINHEEINKRLEFLRSEIERFGDVNLTAIEEYNSVSERYNFLKTQQDDLIHSIKSLHQTIEKIDSATRGMFSETFAKVNENFKGTFRRLFGGGRAELVLVDEGNLLETGVDIIVQPPGKKLQNITLLSAGEKAMTAIALLFSIFMVKPSPFCLLDEVDAPLDESNIFRFRDMLREMCADTQFFIITHNHKTISFADSLYGITMEEDGVSKVISVNLREREAKAA